MPSHISGLHLEQVTGRTDPVVEYRNLGGDDESMFTKVSTYMYINTLWIVEEGLVYPITSNRAHPHEK